MGSCSFYEAWPGTIDYDRWKLASPYDDYEEEEEDRCQCDGNGYIFSGPDDDDGVEVCEQCSATVEFEDLEPLVPA